MGRKELGYVVCVAACFAILLGAILSGTPAGGVLVLGGIATIAGWFIGLRRTKRAEAKGRRSASDLTLL